MGQFCMPGFITCGKTTTNRSHRETFVTAILRSEDEAVRNRLVYAVFRAMPTGIGPLMPVLVVSDLPIRRITGMNAVMRPRLQLFWQVGRRCIQNLRVFVKKSGRRARNVDSVGWHGSTNDLNSHAPEVFEHGFGRKPVGHDAIEVLQIGQKEKGTPVELGVIEAKNDPIR